MMTLLRIVKCFNRLWQSVGLSALLLFSHNVFSAVQSQASLLEPGWVAVVESLPHDRGVFNKSLRQSVRESLDLPKVEGLSDSNLESLLVPRLKKVDSELSSYVRISTNIGSYQQLQRLMPALILIEERKLILRLLQHNGVSAPRLANSRLLPILDKRITRLANGMIFNMKALVRNKGDYESTLLKAMAEQGVKFSARRPDFFLDFDLLSNGRNADGLWQLRGSIALINQYQLTIASAKDVFKVEAKNERAAQAQAVQKLAEQITTQLKTLLIEEALK